MKRAVYILTAILSSAAAAIYIIGYIANINEFGRFYFDIYRCPFTAVLLALSVFSVIQLKKHTPRIILMLCGCVFYESAVTINSEYLFGLLLLAAALIPAIYKFSRYGMAVRLQPKTYEKRRWLLVAAFALALALSAFRVALDIIQAVALRLEGFVFYTADFIGICMLLCAAAFCVFMNRRTSVLYRMFFAGCVLFEALPISSAQYGFLPAYFISDTLKADLTGLAALHALFVLLIFTHSFLARRGGSLILKEAPDIMEQAPGDAGISE